MSDFIKSLDSIKDIIQTESIKIIDFINNPSTKYIKGLFNDVKKCKTNGELEKLDLNGRRGVYVFVLSSDVELHDKFNWTRGGSTLNKPTKRKLKSKDILYVGKSKSLKGRIREHLTGVESSTGSLKLNTEYRKSLLDVVEIYLFLLDPIYKSTDKKKNIAENIILGSVEDILHDELEPKVGSSRI